MKGPEVRALLGAPVGETKIKPGSDQAHPETDEMWDYSDHGMATIARGVRFVIEFNKGQLVHVDSYRRSWWTDNVDHLYALDVHEKSEGKEFERWLCH